MSDKRVFFSFHKISRLALICLAMLAAVSLCACGLGEPAESTPTPTTVKTTAATTEAPTDAPTEAPTAAPTTPAPTNVPGADDPGVYPAFGWVNADQLRVRPTPDTSLYPIGGLKEGDRVNVIGKVGDWYKIEWPGADAYVSAQFIQFTVHIPTGTTPAPTTTTTAAATEASATEAAATTAVSET